MEDNKPNKNGDKWKDEKGRFVKGHPPASDGRPKGSVSIVEGIRRKLLEIEPVNQKTYLELFLNTYFKNAIKEGDSQLIKDMINRIDGMPKQAVDLNNSGSLEVTWKDANRS